VLGWIQRLHEMRTTCKTLHFIPRTFNCRKKFNQNYCILRYFIYRLLWYEFRKRWKHAIILGWKLLKTHIMYCATPEYRCLLCLAVKWVVRWVGLGWVCTLVGRVGLGKEKVTHVYLCDIWAASVVVAQAFPLSQPSKLSQKRCIISDKS